MSDKNDLVLGGIHFGPQTPVSQRPVKFDGLFSRGSKPVWSGPAIRCLVKACPNNKNGKCSSPSSISINVNGVCDTAVLTQTVVPKE